MSAIKEHFHDEIEKGQRVYDVVLLCNDVSPYAMDKREKLYCELPKGHDSFHKNGIARWGRRDRKG